MRAREARRELRRARARARCAAPYDESYAGKPMRIENSAGPQLNWTSNADHLERIDQLRPRQHPRRARSRDPAAGCLVPHAASRVRLADQAEALVPGARA